jgi:hypothetical protein
LKKFIKLKKNDIAQILCYFLVISSKFTALKLPKNYKIEAILAGSSYKIEEYCLIKTEFGLIGCTKVKYSQ